MTAINPAKLRIQSAALVELTEEPERLISALHDLLMFYSSRIRQTDLSSTPLTLEAYQPPPPVLRALQLEIKERLEEDPNPGFALCDHLWKEPWVEFRQLAVATLGGLPPDDPERILTRIQSWLDDCTSEDIRRQIMTIGLKRLAAERPSRCLEYIQQLAGAGKKANLQASLFGLSLFIENEEFANLPLIFKTLSKILAWEESGLVKETTTLIQLLISRSEQEAAYFLIEQLTEAYPPKIKKIARQLLKGFSPENQRLIKEKLNQIK